MTWEKQGKGSSKEKMFLGTLFFAAFLLALFLFLAAPTSTQLRSSEIQARAEGQHQELLSKLAAANYEISDYCIGKGLGAFDYRSMESECTRRQKAVFSEPEECKIPSVFSPSRKRRYDELMACDENDKCNFDPESLSEFSELQKKVEKRQRDMSRLLQKQATCEQANQLRRETDQVTAQAAFEACIAAYESVFSARCAAIELKDGLTLRYLATGNENSNREKTVHYLIYSRLWRKDKPQD